MVQGPCLRNKVSLGKRQNWPEMTAFPYQHSISSTPSTRVEGIGLNEDAISTFRHLLKSSGDDKFEAPNRVCGTHIWFRISKAHQEMEARSLHHPKGRILLGEAKRTSEVLIVVCVCISLIVNEG